MVITFSTELQTVSCTALLSTLGTTGDSFVEGEDLISVYVLGSLFLVLDYTYQCEGNRSNYTTTKP